MIARTIKFICILILGINNLYAAEWYQKKKGASASRWTEIDPQTGNYSPEVARKAAQRIQLLNPNWYYNWSANQHTLVPTTRIPFYPMIQGVEQNRIDYVHTKFTNRTSYYHMDEQVNRIAAEKRANNNRKFKKILLFNEPDNQHDHGPINMHPIISADLTNQNINRMSWYGEQVIAPVMTGIQSKPNSWFEDYFSNLTLHSKNKLKNRAGKLIIPVHYYPDPFRLKFARTYQDMATNSPKREKIINLMVKDFLSKLHLIKRRYNALIMITEFGIADWNADYHPTDNPTGIKNRIPPLFIRDLMAKLLPEINKRSYVIEFAHFSNTTDFNEMLKSNAAFYNRVRIVNGRKVVNEPRLTPVGQVYADFNYRGRCQIGEYTTSSGKIVETILSGCGRPTQFGYGQGNHNGWRYDSNVKGWKRELTREQAGIFQDNSITGCYHNRFTYGQNLVEYKTLACGGSTRGWTPFRNSSGRIIQYRKTINVKTSKVGIIEHYFN